MITNENCQSYHNENWTAMSNPDDESQKMCVDCSPALDGTTVTAACSWWAEQNCPENTLSIANANHVHCYDCSPGVEGEQYTHIECLTNESCQSYHNENWIAMNNPNDDSQIMCVDCSPGLDGAWVPSKCSVVLSPEACGENHIVKEHTRGWNYKMC